MPILGAHKPSRDQTETRSHLTTVRHDVLLYTSVRQAWAL